MIKKEVHFIGITQKQVKKWFANKRVRSQMCYKPLYRSRKVSESVSVCNSGIFLSFKPRNSSSTHARPPQTNYNYIVNHNNIAPPTPNFPPTNPMLFNPMATSMMMLMMQQHFMSTMMAAGVPQIPILAPTPSINTESSSKTTPKKPNGDRITRFWL